MARCFQRKENGRLVQKLPWYWHQAPIATRKRQAGRDPRVHSHHEMVVVHRSELYDPHAFERSQCNSEHREHPDHKYGKRERPRVLAMRFPLALAPTTALVAPVSDLVQAGKGD